MKQLFKKSSPAAPARRRQSDEQSDYRPTQKELEDRYAFRRNRTITGSSSPNVASGNELNAELRSPRAHVHHLSSLRRRLLGYLLGVGLICLGLYILVMQLAASVSFQVAGIGGIDTTLQQTYQRSADAYFAARPVERLRFALHTDRFISHMQAMHPEIASLSIDGTGRPGEAVISLVARKAIARWSIDGRNQYVDASGVVFARNFGETPSLQIIDNSALQSQSTRLVASHRFLGFIGKAVGLATARGMTIRKVTIPTLTSRQVELSVKGTPTRYRLSVDRSVGQQIEDVDRIHQHFRGRSKQPRYVDVRIEGKAFYE